METDVLVGYRDIDMQEIDLDSWFEDREIQEFIEKLEKKSNRLTIKTKFQYQPKFDSKEFIKESELNSDNLEEGKLPLPGGIRRDEEQFIEESNHSEKNITRKSIDLYNYAIEKMTEFKIVFGEILENNRIFDRSPYLTYFYAFLILFGFGIGVGILRNNIKKPIEDKAKIDNSLIKNQDSNVFKKDFINEGKKKSQDKSKISFSEKNYNNSFQVKALTSPSPSLDQTKYLINTWLYKKADFLAGKSEIDISKIVQTNLIKRLTKERQEDIQKGIYKNITTKIEKIELLSQTASRIAVSVELKYTEKIFKTSGDLIDETTFTPFLKVKYILGVYDKSWKLVDYISGV